VRHDRPVIRRTPHAAVCVRHTVAATAAARSDSYCSFAWGITLAGLSDEATAANVLSGLPADLSDREAALAGWSRQVVRYPNAITEADVEVLRHAVFDDREIFEATAWIAFRLALSTINDALVAPPDQQLIESAPELVGGSHHVWAAPARLAALARPERSSAARSPT
jgi:alkylhydroperoxidase family enzyme